MKIHNQKAVLSAIRGEREKDMEYTMILMELVKIRALLTAIIVLFGLLLIAALIIGGVYFSRRMEKALDDALKEETGP